MENLNEVEFKNNELIVWQRKFEARQGSCLGAGVERAVVIVRDINTSYDTLIQQEGCLEGKT